MAPRRKNLPTDDTPEPSLIGMNPYFRLTAAVIGRAFADLNDRRHPERAIDALAWLLSDGLLLCNAIGFFVNESDLFKAIGRHDGRQNVRGRHSGDD